jgi:hypothetical protein
MESSNYTVFYLRICHGWANIVSARILHNYLVKQHCPISYATLRSFLTFYPIISRATPAGRARLDQPVDRRESCTMPHTGLPTAYSNATKDSGFLKARMPRRI